MRAASTATVIGAALCVIAMTILGTSVTLSRVILDYPPLIGQAMRYTVAAAILFGLSTRDSWLGPSARELGYLTALAASGLAAFNLCILLALRHADPAVVGTVVGAAPLGLALAAPLLRHRRPSARVVLAAAVIVAGIAIVQGGGATDRTGLLAAAGALVGEVLFSLLAAAVLPRLGAVRTSAWSCALAVPMLAVGAVVAGERWRPPTLPEGLTLGYLATGLTVIAFVTWFTGLGRLGVDRAGLFVGVLPVSTLVSAAVVDARLPGLTRTAGVALVAAGLAVGLARWPVRRRAASTAPAPVAAARTGP